MFVLVLTSLTAFAAALLLTPGVRAAATWCGVLDCPDGKRKLHRRPVPACGGAAVYLAMVLGLVSFPLVSMQDDVGLDRLSILAIAVGGFICFVGAIDDRYHLRASAKLLLQIVAVLPVVFFGPHVDRLVIFGNSIELGILGPLLTAVWLIGCINAMNLLDGMDGLASTIGLFSAVILGLIAATQGSYHAAVIAVALAGGLAGFLPYNLPRASIFLGDAGSMIIGFIVGVLGLQGSLDTSAALTTTAPMVVMTLPILDTILAVLRRKLTGRRYSEPDRQHIHHRLLDRGLSPWQALGILGTFCLLSGVGATVATIYGSDAVAWSTALVLIVGAVRLRLFGHYEWTLAKNVVAVRLMKWATPANTFKATAHLPTPEHLARLPHDELWALLLQEVTPWKVTRLELILTSPGARPLTCVWTAAKASPVAWTLHLTVDSKKACSCELRASGTSLPSQQFGGLTGLGQVLEAYGVPFAHHSSLQKMPPSTKLEIPATECLSGHRSKAA